jgi:hypothetical protein
MHNLSVHAKHHRIKISPVAKKRLGAVWQTEHPAVDRQM